MDSREIGIVELKGLVGANIRLIAGLAGLFGLVALAWSVWPGPGAHQATARLVAYPGEIPGGSALLGEPANLFTSEVVLRRTSEALIDDGVLPSGATLSPGPGLRSRVYIPDPRRPGPAMVMLTARGASRGAAIAMANTWARIVIEESDSIPQSTSVDVGTALEGTIAETRVRLLELEELRSRLIEEFEARRGKMSNAWDRRIMEARAETAESRPGYHLETRRLLADALLAAARRDGTKAGGDDGEPLEIEDTERRLGFQQLVSVRSQLAETPRILELEQGASEEISGFPRARTEGAPRPAGASTRQELNPLYDELLLTALRIEDELKRGAGPQIALVSEALVALEKAQLERAAAFERREAKSALELKMLRQSRQIALEGLERELSVQMAQHTRRLQQARTLERQMVTRLNTTAVSALLERVKWMKLASHAGSDPVGPPRLAFIKVAAGIVLGGMLGLMIALFRESDTV